MALRSINSALAILVLAACAEDSELTGLLKPVGSAQAVRSDAVAGPELPWVGANTCEERSLPVQLLETSGETGLRPYAF